MNANVKRWLPLGIIWVAAVVSGVIFVTSRDDDASASASAAQPTASPQRNGFDPSTAPSGPRFRSGGDGSDALSEFTECLSEHGVELSPGSGRPDFGDTDVREAFEACRQYLPGMSGRDRGFGPPPGGFDGTPQPGAPSQDRADSGSDV
jgi:hypothetical protein